MAGGVTELIEMYLRIILECEEERVPPISARIAERLGRSLPTVHKNVNRLKALGLVGAGEDDRHLVLSRAGRRLATAVMRKHRLAELLLVRILAVPYGQAHNEANRLQHVLSEQVERHLYRALGHPTHSPYGNPIPGLSEIGGVTASRRTPRNDGDLAQPGLAGNVVVTRIREWSQSDTELMDELRSAGVLAGRIAQVAPDGDEVVIGAAGSKVRLPTGRARGIFVSKDLRLAERYH